MFIIIPIIIIIITDYFSLFNLIFAGRSESAAGAFGAVVILDECDTSTTQNSPLGETLDVCSHRSPEKHTFSLPESLALLSAPQTSSPASNKSCGSATVWFRSVFLPGRPHPSLDTHTEPPPPQRCGVSYAQPAGSRWVRRHTLINPKHPRFVLPSTRCHKAEVAALSSSSKNTLTSPQGDTIAGRLSHTPIS